MAEIEQTINTTTRMVVSISEKRCGCYAHPTKMYTKLFQMGLFIINMSGRTLNVQNIILEDEPS